MFEFKLALKYLKKNKTESISIIACIVVAITLVLGVDIGANSIQLNQIEMAKEIEGYYDGTLTTNIKENIEKLNGIKGISNVHTVGDLGSLTLNDGLNTVLYTFNEDYLKSLNYKLVSGRFPKYENEIVIDKNALDKREHEKVLNKEISAINKIYYSSQGIDKIYSKKTKYKVVGFIGKVDGYYESADKGLKIASFVKTSYNVLPKELIKYETVFNIEGINERNLDEKFSYIREEYNPKSNYNVDIRQDSDSGISSNPYLDATLRYYKDQQNNNEVQSKIFLIIIAAFTIVNFYSIVLTKLTDQIGQLRVVGMSNKKVVKFYLAQIFILFSIGAIMGVMSSIIFTRYSMSTFITLNIFNVSEFSKVKLSIPYSIMAIDLLVILIVLLVTVFLPVLKTLREYPIEIINKSDKINYKVNKNKKILITLLKNNLFRKKSKTLMPIVLISLSGIMVIGSTATNLDYLINQSRKNGFAPENKYNYIIRPDINADTGIKKISKKEILTLKNTQGVKDFRLDSYSLGKLDIEKNKLNKRYSEIFGVKESNSKSQNVDVTFTGVETLNKLNEFIIEGNIEDLSKSSKEYLNIAVCNKFYDFANVNFKYGVKDLKPGDTLNLKIESKREDGTYYYKEIKGKVSVILDSTYMLKNEIVTNSGIRIVMDLDDLDRITNNNYTQQICFNGKKDSNSKINKVLDNIDQNNKFLKVYDREGSRSKFKIVFPIIIILLVMVSALFNIYITINLNVSNNIKEFSILRAIGLNKKCLKKLVIYESISYGFLGSILALIVIAIKDIKYIKHLTSLQSSTSGVELKVKSIYMPPKEGLIYMLIIILFAFVVGYFKSKSIDKINIIEGINED